MSAPFAAIETATAASVVAALANATATLSVGGSAEGIFDAPSAEAFGLVSGRARSFTGKTTDLSAVTVGSTLTIGGTAYTVAGLEPDGTGMTRVVLK